MCGRTACWILLSLSSDSQAARERGIVGRVRERALGMRSRRFAGDHDLKVGLLPQQGWGRRNWKFVNDVLVPTYFTPRGGIARAHELPSVEQSEIGLVWIGHASFLIQIGGKNILVDPNWARWLGFVKRVREPGMRIEDLPPIDMVLVSHAHYDHLHLGSLKQVADGQPIVVPHGVGSIVERRGFGDVVELDCWESVEIDGMQISLTPARHWGARNIHDTHRGFGGFVIKADGRSVFHCGDSAYFEGFTEIGERFPDIDVAIMPIGAYGAPSGREVHMNPRQALDAFRQIGAGKMVPMHYATFPLGTEPMHEPLELLHEHADEVGVSESLHVLDEGDLLRF